MDTTARQSASGDAGDVCWICLDEGTPSNPLLRRCKCPRAAHQACIARWQLQSAGKLEEKHCRFCQSVLPDWRPAMTPAGHKPVTPFMRVSYGGKSFKVKVNPGPEGLQQFEQEVRRLLKLPEEQEFDVIFHCRAPCSGDLLQLHGTSAFDAAVHCAAMSSSTGAVKKRHSILKQKAGTYLRQLFSRLQLRRGGAAASGST